MEKLEDVATDFKENFQTQLAELEMLQSVFGNPGEIQVEDYLAMADMNDYVDNKIKTLPTYLSFNVNLTVENLSFCLCAELPHEYPFVKPDIFVRISSQNRTQQQKLNTDIKNYLTDLESGDICIFSIITWLQDNITNYIEGSEVTQPNLTNKCDKITTCSRFWIYSHHIYSKIKRKEILNLSNNYSLTGFCLPGKPGVICIEGYTNDCNTFWSYIKSMTWKKIVCKLMETDEVDIEGFRRFKTFEEISFQTAGNRSNHMDMGDFYTYLEAHSCEYIFKELFGIDGKSS